MGGTSTDVSHYAGRYELGDENLIAGVRIRAPMMQIHTIAAGGGSICRFDGMRFRVGPESAGAQARPRLLPRRRAADRHRLQPVPRPDRPGAISRRCSGPSGDQPLDPEASRARLQEVADALGGAKSLEEIAEGFLDIAVDNMAAAIRKISIARGHDVTRYTLACFGGAGGQHACRVADALGMERILIHPLAGVLSAYGIGLADVKAVREASWLKPLERGFLGRRARRWKQAARQRPGRPGLRGRAGPFRTPRPAAHAGQRHDDRSRARRAGGDARGVRGAAPQALRLHRRG